jgi:hypothetical protein
MVTRMVTRMVARSVRQMIGMTERPMAQKRVRTLARLTARLKARLMARLLPMEALELAMAVADWEVAVPKAEAAAVLVGGSPRPGILAPPAQRSSPSVMRQEAAASPLSLDAWSTIQHPQRLCPQPPQTALRTCMRQLWAAQSHRSPTPRSPIRSECCSSHCGHTPPPHPPPTSPAASPIATHPADGEQTGRC